MKKNYTLLVVLFVLALMPEAKAQTDYRDGYILTLKNDTIWGKVDYSSGKKNFKACKFKKDNEVTKYAPQELLGYGFINDKTFISGIVPDAFVEVLVKGYLSLYRHNTDFILKKEGEKMQRMVRFITRKVYGQDFVDEDKRWRGILSHMMVDCKVVTETPNRYRFSEKYFTKVTREYNECKGSAYKVYKVGKVWNKVKFGFKGGMDHTWLKADTGHPELDYFPKSMTSSAPFVSFYLEYSSPRLSDKLSVISEVFITKADISAIREKVAPGGYSVKHDVNFQFSKIGFPLAIKYRIPKEKIEYYGLVGPSFEYNFGTSYKRIREHLSYKSEYDNLNIPRMQFGAFVGLGLTRSFKTFNAGLEMKYYRLTPLSQTQGLDIHFHRFSVGITLSR